MLLELADIERARTRTGGRVHATPMLSSTTVGDELGVRLHLKAELFQKTGSFKPRGVFNKLLSMDSASRARGLVSLSAGNHAAALAYGAEAKLISPARLRKSQKQVKKLVAGPVVYICGVCMDLCNEVRAV